MDRTDTEELWKLFFEYEQTVHRFGNADHKLASATMANAIATILAARESVSLKEK